MEAVGHRGFAHHVFFNANNELLGTLLFEVASVFIVYLSGFIEFIGSSATRVNAIGVNTIDLLLHFSLTG